MKRALDTATHAPIVAEDMRLLLLDGFFTLLHASKEGRAIEDAAQSFGKNERLELYCCATDIPTELIGMTCLACRPSLDVIFFAIKFVKKNAQGTILHYPFPVEHSRMTPPMLPYYMFPRVAKFTKKISRALATEYNAEHLDVQHVTAIQLLKSDTMASFLALMSVQTALQSFAALCIPDHKRKNSNAFAWIKVHVGAVEFIVILQLIKNMYNNHPHNLVRFFVVFIQQIKAFLVLLSRWYTTKIPEINNDIHVKELFNVHMNKQFNKNLYDRDVILVTAEYLFISNLNPLQCYANIPRTVSLPFPIQTKHAFTCFNDVGGSEAELPLLTLRFRVVSQSLDLLYMDYENEMQLGHYEYNPSYHIYEKFQNEIRRRIVHPLDKQLTAEQPMLAFPVGCHRLDLRISDNGNYYLFTGPWISNKEDQIIIENPFLKTQETLF